MDLKRRDFLKIVGATTVATALPGCTPREPKSLIPYIIPHEEIIPGRSVWYATVCRECPAGCGMKVRVREGRATKAEGNPLHPMNKGALCARGQASLQGLYNPDRNQSPLRRNSAGTWEELSWESAQEFLVAQLKAVVSQAKSSSIAWVSSHTTGTLDELIDSWLKALGSTQRYRCEPFNHEALRQANDLAFGIPAIPTLDLSGADVVLSFGTDFLEHWLSPVAHAAQFSHTKGFQNGHRGRSVYLGPRLSMTASSADEWISVSPESLGVIAMGLAHVVAREPADSLPAAELSRVRELTEPFFLDRVAQASGVPAARLEALARMLVSSKSAVALAGGPLLENDDGVRTIAAVNILNHVLGATARCIRFGEESSLSRLSSNQEVMGLIEAMEQGRVPAIFLSDTNPVFALPAGERFAAALRAVPLVVSLASCKDETSSLATLILPVHTPLESWGDFEPSGGIHGLMQPVMTPVFKTKMTGDILLETGRQLGLRDVPDTFQAALHERWRTLHARLAPAMPFETFWVESLARGGVWEEPRTLRPKLSLRLRPADLPAMRGALSSSIGTLSLIVYPSIGLFDGRGANKTWLQELPDPVTRLVWGSWVELSPHDAAALGVQDGDPVIVASEQTSIELPVYIHRGLAAGCAAVPMGQGHTDFGRYASGVGVNPVRLLQHAPAGGSFAGVHWHGTRVTVRKGTAKLRSASVQESASQHGREIVQEISIAALVSGPAGSDRSDAPSVYPPQSYARHHWGMVVDIDKCTGCGACVTACYAENNIPVVGREEVMNGREMAWLRIDRYFDEAPASGTRARFVPMFCQQCGDAPCETVCPVYAAYHTEEGLNGQVYNRCIGTRYCANNCPYKVRRFNWFAHDWPSPLNWQLNPDVTVRSKGVMEKCTFCIQRIVEGKNNARMEHRQVNDGEIVTACQQTCPARAIQFGDLLDPASTVAVVTKSDQPRTYHILEELNTLPAVTYLKGIRKETSGPLG